MKWIDRTKGSKDNGLFSYSLLFDVLHRNHLIVSAAVTITASPPTTGDPWELLLAALRVVHVGVWPRRWRSVPGRLGGRTVCCSATASGGVATSSTESKRDRL